MKQLYAYLILGMIAALTMAGYEPAVAQTQIQYKSSQNKATGKHYNLYKRSQRRYARGPRRMNTRVFYRHTPRLSKKAYNKASPRERQQRYKRFNGYFQQRLPHLENGYYNYKAWPYYYNRRYGYAQPYTPYFSHYFTPFNDGHFTGYFQH